MERMDLLTNLSQLFDYKTVSDLEGNELVLLRSSTINIIDFQVADKTEFEAIENHVHIIDRIKRKEIPALVKVSNIIGLSSSNNLTHYVLLVGMLALWLRQARRIYRCEC